MSFGKKTLMWKFYTINKFLPISKQIQLINQKKFGIAVFDANSKTFVMHMAIRKQVEIPIHFEKQAQIEAVISWSLRLKSHNR